MRKKRKQTLEELTGCRLFSGRAVAAIAEHQYSRFEYDEDLAEDLSFALRKPLLQHDPAIAAHVIRDLVCDRLTHEPEQLANLVAFLGLVLDCELLRREELERTREMRAAGKYH